MSFFPNGLFQKFTSPKISCFLFFFFGAQHGSKASTSKSGSADFLEELGIPIGALPPASIPLESRFLFLFAINFHPTFAITGPIRREMGFATIYNLLGPLINPARPDATVLGVYSPELGNIFATTLKLLGMKRAWVVCGAEGLDEISPSGDTDVSPSPSFPDLQ